MHTWIDEQTRREVRQLTTVPTGARVPYFRFPRHLPDGRILVGDECGNGARAVVDVATGDIQQVTACRGRLVK